MNSVWGTLRVTQITAVPLASILGRLGFTESTIGAMLGHSAVRSPVGMSITSTLCSSRRRMRSQKQFMK
jgi:hypothetical protein